MRTDIIGYRGWCRQRKLYDLSTWVPVWVTLYPRGDGGGGEREWGKMESPPRLACGYLGYKEKQIRFSNESGCHAALSICHCKIKGKFKIGSDTSRDLTYTLWTYWETQQNQSQF